MTHTFWKNTNVGEANAYFFIKKLQFNTFLVCWLIKSQREIYCKQWWFGIWHFISQQHFTFSLLWKWKAYLSLLNMVNSIQMSSNQFRIEFSEFHRLQKKFRNNKRNFVILSCQFSEICQFQKILAEFRTFCTKLKNSQCPPLSNHLWN